MTPVQLAVAEYLAHGWRLCRINPGSKGPRDKLWNEPEHFIRSTEGFPLGWGVGLLHAFSGTMALDIDNYPVAKTWLDERGVDLDGLLAADDAVQISSGKIDSAKLIYSMPIPRPGKGCAPFPAFDKNGAPRTALALDFRCATLGGNSQQDALPPTIHPGRGVPYEWRFGIMASWQLLPELPTALEAIWDEIAPPVSTSAPPEVAVPTGAAPERIQAWLDTQDPGMCRNDWVKVGFKLHAEFQGSMDGFKIWQAWSAKSNKWDDEAREKMYPMWKGFRLEGRQLATLETDLREMPAQPSDFPVIPNVQLEITQEFAAPTADALAAIGELTLDESPFDKAAREMLENHVVYQTGGNKPFFLLPGHPEKSICDAAGLAGAEKTHEQLSSIFAPYMPDKPHPKLRALVRMDALEVLRQAKWRKQVHRMAFNPGGPDEYFDDDGHRYLNAYKPIQVEPVKPTAAQIAPLEWLLRRVLDNKSQPTGGVFASWLVRLYAFVLQNPGVKVKWAPLLYSAEQGTGKTTLMETLPALLFGRQYVKPMVHSVLRERFAGAKFDSTWWVCLSEMHSDAGKVDARTIANKLKPWITDGTIQIEKKGVDSYEIKNHLQFTAVSNHDDALFIEEGSTDRRWLIGEMLGIPLTISEMAFLNPLFGDDFKRDPRAQSWLHWYFKNDVNLIGFNPSESPPETEAKKKVREQSRSVWEDKVFAAFEDMAPPFDKDIVIPRDLTESLLVGQRLTIAQAKTLLRLVGATSLPRTDRHRDVYCVRNRTLWEGATPAEIHTHLQSGLRPFKIEGEDDANDLIGTIDAKP
jgi:hypothetical protein